MLITELREAVTSLTPRAEDWLIQQFGTAEAFVHGYGYHNYNHGADVSSAAELIASKLHEARRVRPEAVLLAPYAGWRHDARQGKDHEKRSAKDAARSMRARNIPEPYITTVVNMIEATRVLSVDGYRIVQAADPNDPEQALLADADLSCLGRKSGVYSALLLGIEQQYLNRLITLPSPTDGMLAEPNRDVMTKFLKFQFGLHNSHRFMLEATRRLFPHQGGNRDELGKLIELYTADRITYREMLTRAKRRAQS